MGENRKLKLKTCGRFNHHLNMYGRYVTIQSKTDHWIPSSGFVISWTASKYVFFALFYDSRCNLPFNLFGTFWW